jgi:hypothetical protein
MKQSNRLLRRFSTVMGVGVGVAKMSQQKIITVMGVYKGCNLKYNYYMRIKGIMLCNLNLLIQ